MRQAGGLQACNVPQRTIRRSHIALDSPGQYKPVYDATAVENHNWPIAELGPWSDSLGALGY